MVGKETREWLSTASSAERKMERFLLRLLGWEAASLRKKDTVGEKKL